MMNLRQVLRVAVPFVAGGALATGVTLAAYHPVPKQTELGKTLRYDNSGYEYVKPLLACDVGVQIESSELAPLKNTLLSLANAAERQGDAQNVSVFVRVLDNGLWTTINPDDTYSPGSLLKVPIFMAYLKQAQSDHDLLGRKITVTSDPADGIPQAIPAEQSVEVGKTYTVEDLLLSMIMYSDNTALGILMNDIDPTVLNNIFIDLGIPIPKAGDDYALTARIYSRFFRILYNATYLWTSSSDRALSILADTTYNDGIVAGVPSDTVVAHKFGEAGVKLQNGELGHELHDCGIVYSDEPYAICVMTRGQDINKLASLIAAMSEAVYSFTTKP